MFFAKHVNFDSVDIQILLQWIISASGGQHNPNAPAFTVYGSGQVTCVCWTKSSLWCALTSVPLAPFALSSRSPVRVCALVDTQFWYFRVILMHTWRKHNDRKLILYSVLFTGGKNIVVILKSHFFQLCQQPPEVSPPHTPTDMMLSLIVRWSSQALYF